MKAIHVTHFADGDNLAFVEDASKPALDPASNDILVRVLASAVNPGDCHVMRGSVSLFVKPKQFPYTPGMDVCGIVESVGQRCTSFTLGDRVAVVLGPIERHGGLAEYLICDAKQATLAPTALTHVQVAALPIAGATAIQAVEDARVVAGSRVVVLGASGGVGSLVVQVAKAYGASFVAATSTNAELVTSLGADCVLDYRTTTWWDALAEHGRTFDAIIDCVGCDDSWANCDRVLARHGRYVAVANATDPRIRTVGEFVRYLGLVLPRALNPFTTSYKMVVCFPTGNEIQKVLALAAEGKIRVVLDPATPYAFSLASVRAAFDRQHSHRAKGKLVVQISPDKTPLG